MIGFLKSKGVMAIPPIDASQALTGFAAPVAAAIGGGIEWALLIVACGAATSAWLAQSALKAEGEAVTAKFVWLRLLPLPFVWICTSVAVLALPEIWPAIHGRRLLVAALEAGVIVGSLGPALAPLLASVAEKFIKSKSA